MSKAAQHPFAGLEELMKNIEYGKAPESQKFAWEWLLDNEEKPKKWGHFIGGKFEKPGKKLFEAYNPGTGEVLGEFTQGTKADVNRAFKAAEAAFEEWSAMSGSERAGYLYEVERLIKMHARLGAVLGALNKGECVIKMMKGEIPHIAQYWGHHAAFAENIKRILPGRKPGGPIGSIIAPNYPVMLFTWKVATAIAAGNTIVIKPGDTTPVTAMWMAEIFQMANLPDGVVNIVTGDLQVGKHIVSHQTPWKISFTGSSRAGKEIRLATADTDKKLTLELGGNGTCIVFSDADLDSVVESTVRGGLGNKGEMCCRINNVVAEESIAESLRQRLERRLSRIRIGDQMDKCTQQGPQNNPRWQKDAMNWVEVAEEHGAKKFVGGMCDDSIQNTMRPTILYCEQSNPACSTEIFGPVITFQTFRNKETAIKLANNDEYGLSCAIWSSNISKAREVAARVRAGVKSINGETQFDGGSGFGGVGLSGFGHEGGLEGLVCVTVPEHAETDFEPSLHEPLPEDEQWVPSDYDQEIGHIHTTGRSLVGNKLQRSDHQRCFPVKTPSGEVICYSNDCNRKNGRNAVVAAEKATAGSRNQRRMVLMFMAEKLFHARERLILDIIMQTGRTRESAAWELNTSIKALRSAASWAVTLTGRVQNVANTTMQVTATHDPQGVVVIKGEGRFPLLGLIKPIAAAYAFCNRIVAVSGSGGEATAEHIAEIIQNADVKPGEINILTAEDPNKLTGGLANHGTVNLVVSFCEGEDAKVIRENSATDMKRTWIIGPEEAIHLLAEDGVSEEWCHQMTQVCNTWMPIGA